MDYAALRNEILGGPHAAECAPYVVNYDAPKTPDAYSKDQAIANVLNGAPGGTVYRTRFVDALGLLAELDPIDAAVILDKLETAAASNSAVKWAMKYITGSGIDVGHPSTRAMLQMLADGGALTQGEVDSLIGLAAVTVGRAEALFSRPVTAADVSMALRGGAAFDPQE